MPARLEVIPGPMFSGKTEELIRRVKRAEWAHKPVLRIKPLRDTRANCITARSVVNGVVVCTDSMPAEEVSSARDILALTDTVRPAVIGIDEAQFFEPWIIDVVRCLLNDQQATDLRIIVSGLDLDYAREPFGSMPQLLAMADDVTKLTGVCMKCGADGARFTQRVAGGTDRVQVGNFGDYEVRCRLCHYIFGVEEPR